VGVKWPNDLLVAERKLGGILCESGMAEQSTPFQVIGIGLNLNGELTDLPEEIRHIATTVRHETGHSVDRCRVLAQLLNELEECVEEFEARGSERIALAYRQRSSTIGRTIRATLTEGREFVGLAEGIAQDGSLTVVQRPLPTDGRTPETVHLRVADIIHVRI
jgi:BirA family biotin operon repressor/biotin-[acetyl-CoA-carboxylase] ligase